MLWVPHPEQVHVAPLLLSCHHYLPGRDCPGNYHLREEGQCRDCVHVSLGEFIDLWVEFWSDTMLNWLFPLLKFVCFERYYFSPRPGIEINFKIPQETII